MYLNRGLLKQQARIIMARAVPRPTQAAMIFAALTLLVSVLSGRLASYNITTADLQRYMQYVQNGYYDGAINILVDTRPSGFAQLISFLLSFCLRVVAAGFIIYLLNTIRCTGPVLGNLLDGFGFLGRLIVLELLQTVFITLWSMLFVIPGIIAAYRYSMSLYLLIDHPEMSPLDCIRESKRMMAGHKWELFVLELSFIGWTILESFNFIGPLVMIYTLPYKGLTYALYYEALCGRTYFPQPPQMPNMGY